MTHGPVFQAHSPVFQTHGPVFKAHGPVFQTHGPVFQTHGAVFQTHGPVFQTHGPVFQAHGPEFQAHGGGFDALLAEWRLDGVCDRCTHLGGAQLLCAFAPDVASAQAGLDDLLHRSLDRVGCGDLPEGVAEHHRDAENLR